MLGSGGSNLSRTGTAASRLAGDTGTQKAFVTASSIRLYTPQEVIDMLERLGLCIDRLFSGYRDKAVATSSDRLVVIGHLCSDEPGGCKSED